VSKPWVYTEALPIVEQVARSLARGQWQSDYDDLVQEGLVAVWREGVRDPGLVAVCARRRMIDAQRRSYGRVGTQAYEARMVQWSMDYPVGDGSVRFSDVWGREDGGYDSVEARQMLPHLEDPDLKLDPREREVVRRQARGELLREIGASWGVTEARACQISIRARRKLRRAIEDDGE